LVEVQKHVVSKVIFVTIMFDHRNVFSPWSQYIIFFEKVKVDSKFTSKRIWKLDLHLELALESWTCKKIVGGKYYSTKIMHPMHARMQTRAKSEKPKLE